MKGNNVIEINQATMCAALEVYFRDVFTLDNRPKVESVTAIIDPYRQELPQAFKIITMNQMRELEGIDGSAF